MSNDVLIAVLLEEGSELPLYSTDLASGADVRAALKEPLLLKPRQRALIKTGLRFVIAPGYEIQVRPRSGLALKHGITVLNSPGTIDADYRGELGIILINHGEEPFLVEPAMRIAQIVVAPVVRARFVSTTDPETLLYASTQRGEGGFGHTGVK